MDVEIGLKGQVREEVGRVLNKLLADEHVLYIKTRNYHWNVVGPKFRTLHQFFEEQYKLLAPMIDDVAERARSVGVLATGTMAQFTSDARLSEDSGHPDADSMIEHLLADHESVISQLRKDIERVEDELEDAGTADFLTGLMQQHEEQAWMLRAHLEKPRSA
jgi:starvation-inducible DNA-binding protein